jgi:enamine deaminase RidA (YjgF/YER057c/UK114 family)
MQRHQVSGTRGSPGQPPRVFPIVMSPTSPHPLVRPLLTFDAGPGKLPLAAGTRAGDWVFATGLLPSAFGSSTRPLSGEPQWTAQFRSLWTHAQEVLRAGGSDLSRVVRADQFFTDWRAVPFFHEARRNACGKHIPPSTSVLEAGLLLPRAAVAMNLLAVSADGPAITPLFPEGLDLPATSSFVPVMRTGGFVFVAGLMAAWKEGDLGGIAPEAKVPEGHLWKGNRIQLETEYLIRRKLEVALQGAGCSLDRVVKADVFLSDVNDAPAFNQVWARAFGGKVPATTITMTTQPGFAIADARIEINLVAATDELRIERIEVESGAASVCDGYPLAVRAGDLLFFSGMVAADTEGLVQPARIDPCAPYFGLSIDVQMDYLLSLADHACRQAGTRLENVLRIQQAHTTLHDFHPACRQWQQRLPGVHLPISAIEVPGPLLVPGCTVQLDLVVYAP